VISAIALGVVAFMGFNFVQSAAKEVGPVNNTTVQKSLGSDIPIYPGAKLNQPGTTTALVALRTTEKAMKQGGKSVPGKLFEGIAIYTTADQATKVIEFYEKRMKVAGWAPLQNRAQHSAAVEQRLFRKGKRFAMIQVQEGGAETAITIMRGGPGLTQPGATNLGK
jgi:hypothetical protein